MRRDGKQLTIYESEVRARAKETEAESVAHDFTCAVVYSGLPLYQADTFIGKVLRKYCPAASTIPAAHQLTHKYLPKIYDKHIMSHIKQKWWIRKFA